MFQNRNYTWHYICLKIEIQSIKSRPRFNKNSCNTNCQRAFISHSSHFYQKYMNFCILKSSMLFIMSRCHFEFEANISWPPVTFLFWWQVMVRPIWREKVTWLHIWTYFWFISADYSLGWLALNFSLLVEWDKGGQNFNICFTALIKSPTVLAWIWLPIFFCFWNFVPKWTYFWELFKINWHL